MKVETFQKMTLKIKSSSVFRKNTPGESLGSIRWMAKYKGQLYTFSYRSWGHYRKGIKKKNLDAYPVLLLAFREGHKTWKAANGKRYIYGFNLNYLPPKRRLDVARAISQKLSGDVEYTYDELKASFDLPTSKGSTIFRKYDVRGGKLSRLKQVDLDKYITYLDDSITMSDTPSL